MKRLFLVFSHKLTVDQQKDAMINFGIKEFIYLPDKLQKVWSNIDPKALEISADINQIINHIIENFTIEDYILVQGDFGATYRVVNTLSNLGFRCIYSTTVRKSLEVRENNIIIKSSIFEHVKFRRYE